MKTMLRNSNKYDNEFILQDYVRTFGIFKNIEKYSLKQNVRIINAGVGGALDMFKRVKYETLFPKYN